MVHIKREMLKIAVTTSFLKETSNAYTVDSRLIESSSTGLQLNQEKIEGGGMCCCNKWICLFNREHTVHTSIYVCRLQRVKEANYYCNLCSRVAATFTLYPLPRCLIYYHLGLQYFVSIIDERQLSKILLCASVNAEVIYCY